jgi:hypothetical protein
VEKQFVKKIGQTDGNKKQTLEIAATLAMTLVGSTL